MDEIKLKVPRWSYKKEGSLIVTLLKSTNAHLGYLEGDYVHIGQKSSHKHYGYLPDYNSNYSTVLLLITI